MQIRCAEVDWAGQGGHFTEDWHSRIDDDHDLEGDDGDDDDDDDCDDGDDDDDDEDDDDDDDDVDDGEIMLMPLLYLNVSGRTREGRKRGGRLSPCLQVRCVCVSVFVRLCQCPCMSVFVCLCARMSVFVCLGLGARVSVCLCLQL